VVRLTRRSHGAAPIRRGRAATRAAALAGNHRGFFVFNPLLDFIGAALQASWSAGATEPDKDPAFRQGGSPNFPKSIVRFLRSAEFLGRASGSGVDRQVTHVA
jgi:hypothetical protein